MVHDLAQGFSLAMTPKIPLSSLSILCAGTGLLKSGTGWRTKEKETQD
jgi:hypothetical protein